MKIQFLVKTNARSNKVLKIDDNNYKVWVKEPAKEGKANNAVIELMSKHLSVAKSNVKLVSGKKSKYKTLEIH